MIKKCFLGLVMVLCSVSMRSQGDRDMQPLSPEERQVLIAAIMRAQQTQTVSDEDRMAIQRALQGGQLIFVQNTNGASGQATAQTTQDVEKPVQARDWTIVETVLHLLCMGLFMLPKIVAAQVPTIVVG